MLIPKTDRRKDWEDKAMVGYFIGHSKTTAGYPILTSVHVSFDESIPERGDDYFRDLDEATVKSHPEERQVGDFDWLEGQYYVDEGPLCCTERSYRWFSFSNYRWEVAGGGQDYHSHCLPAINDGGVFSTATQKVWGDGVSGSDSTVTAGVTPPTNEPENLSEMNVPPSGVPESGGKRVRTKRVLHNKYGSVKK